MANSIYGKKSDKKTVLKRYCKLICFANIPNFQGPLCDIKMLIYFSTKQVLPEFWQDCACQHLWTLQVLSQDSSLTLQQQKIPTNYCELILHAIFTKLIGSLHDTLKITFFQTNNFYSIIVDARNKFASKTDIFVATLDPTTNRLKHLNAVIRTLKIALIYFLETFLKKPLFPWFLSTKTSTRTILVPKKVLKCMGKP